MEVPKDLTDRHLHHRGRDKIGEKSPISLVRMATQNFNDLARTTRYMSQERENAANQVVVADSSPRVINSHRK